METIIFPFSFREFLTHHGLELPDDRSFLPKRKRSKIERMFLDYLKWGGFPEAQGIADRDRISLIQGYADAAVFRDVVERHEITNVTALRHLVRHLLNSPAGLFSVHKFHNDLRSRGVPVAKDSLHQFLGHLEDAFLLRLIPLATTSERRRESNPRKVYPIDPAIAVAFDRSGKANTGQLLETVALVELERRRCESAYVLSPGGFEVDFQAVLPEGRRMLIQVAANLEDEAARTREIRALVDAIPEYRKAQPLLLTLTTTDTLASKSTAPRGIAVLPVWEWLLSGNS
jgi:predicted AAA+ superfamily ATPase